MKKYANKPLEERQFVLTIREAAAVAGVHPNTVREWKVKHPGFPILPCPKTAITAYQQRNGLMFRKCTVPPAPPHPLREKVMQLFAAGFGPRGIGRMLGIDPANVCRMRNHEILRQQKHKLEE